MKRKMIKVEDSLDVYSYFDGSLSNIRRAVDDLIEKYGEKAIVDIYFGGMDSYDESSIRYERLETEQEARKRLADARKAREKKKADKLKQEEKEKAELRRLLEKYDLS